MKAEDIEIGDEVQFLDEFGNPRIGTVVSTEAFGTPRSFGINTETGYGTYARSAEEIMGKGEEVTSAKA